MIHVTCPSCATNLDCFELYRRTGGLHLSAGRSAYCPTCFLIHGTNVTMGTKLPFFHLLASEPLGHCQVCDPQEFFDYFPLQVEEEVKRHIGTWRLAPDWNVVFDPYVAHALLNYTPNGWQRGPLAGPPYSPGPKAITLLQGELRCGCNTCEHLKINPYEG